MSLSGSLTSVNLAEIMQLISNSKQTGRFIITKNTGEKGFIYINKGEIIHSEVENFKGEDAVFTLTSWEQGEFVFEEGIFNEKASISTSVTSLLMESAKRIDEWKLLRKKIGSIDSIPSFNEVDRNERRKISLSTLEWMVISKIDGTKTINEISKETAVNIFDTSRMIFGMIASKLIKLK